MLTQIRRLYYLLNLMQRRNLLKLQILLVISAIGEVAVVFSIGSFMALISDLGKLDTPGIIRDIYLVSQARDPSQFLFWLGAALLGLLIFSTLISTLTSWRLSFYGNQLGAELSTRLYTYYMRQSWLFHTSHRSAQLINNIVSECNRLTGAVIMQLLVLNSRLALGGLLIISLLLYSPYIALTGIFLFATIYAVLYQTVRMKLVKKGALITQANRERMKLMQEGFGGIKDILLLGRQDPLINRYTKASDQFGRATGSAAVMAQIPKYVIELFAIGSIIVLALYLMATYDGQVNLLLPQLAIYALAGLKLLPTFQQSYAAIVSVRANMASFNSLEAELENSMEHLQKQNKTISSEKLEMRHGITLNNVTFQYPEKTQSVLNDINMVINTGEIVGIVGPSGSGKSTLVDIILGLIQPEAGSICIDNYELTQHNRRLWQDKIGYVPQSIFLADASIRENIAFGIAPEAVNSERVESAIRLAQLDTFISGLPQGLKTQVGERGTQLSGGQRQRIGIARALYEDPELLVLDEGTSSLDTITEANVMLAISEFAEAKTVIMIAHRLATVKSCDRIYFLEDGHVIVQGNYQELIESSTAFREMAKDLSYTTSAQHSQKQP